METASGQANTVTGNAFVTETQPFSQELMEQLILPDGFEISVFAQELGNARMMVVSETGVIYVSRPAEGDVIALFDQNSDGNVDTEGFRVVASDIPQVHGLAIAPDGALLISDDTNGII